MAQTWSDFAAVRRAVNLDEPALPPPPGVEPQFSRQSPEQAWYYVVAVLGTVATGSLYVLRMYTKIRIVRKVDITDYLITGAFLIYLTMIAIGRILIKLGCGVHQWNVTHQELLDILFWMYVVEFLYAPCIFLIKTTILLQYLRLLAPTRSVNHVVYFGSWALLITITVVYIMVFVFNLVMCDPMEKIWNKFLENATCLNREAILTFIAVFNIVSDICIMILPISTIWRLHIPTRKKFGISLLFVVGIFACISNIVFIFFATRLVAANADESYNSAWLGLSALTEISFGVIVSCMLSLPKFLEKRGRKLLLKVSSLTGPLTSSRRSRSNNYPSFVADPANRPPNSDSNLPLPSNSAPLAVPTIRMGQTLSETELHYATGDDTFGSYPMETMSQRRRDSADRSVQGV